MKSPQYRQDNTEGYSEHDLMELNQIFEHRVSLLEEAGVLDEDERANKGILQYLSEITLRDYDFARDLVPSVLIDVDDQEIRIAAIHDIYLRGEGDLRAAVALVDLDAGDRGTFEGVVLAAYPDGEIVTQADWQSPVGAIPWDLRELQWQKGGRPCVVGDDGLPRDAELW
jgi:hypothetical protein